MLARGPFSQRCLRYSYRGRRYYGRSYGTFDYRIDHRRELFICILLPPGADSMNAIVSRSVLKVDTSMATVVLGQLHPRAGRRIIRGCGRRYDLESAQNHLERHQRRDVIAHAYASIVYV